MRPLGAPVRGRLRSGLRHVGCHYSAQRERWREVTLRNGSFANSPSSQPKRTCLPDPWVSGLGGGDGGGTWMVSKAWRCLVKDASGGVSGDALSLLTGAEPGPALMAQGSISFPGSGPTVRRLREQGGPTSSTSEAPCIRRRSPPPPPKKDGEWLSSLGSRAVSDRQTQ